MANYLTNKALFQPGLFINNAFVQPEGPEFEVIDPGTGKAWTTLASATADDVATAVSAAQTAFRQFKNVTARERAKLLVEWDRLIRANKQDIAILLVLETGKPLKEAIAEIDYALSFVWWMAGEAERTTGSLINGNGPGPGANNRFLVMKQPVGVVATLTPWNFPVALFLRKAATAIAAGCTLVSKPSPETPMTASALAKLASEAGFPPGVINILPCNEENTPAIGEALCVHPKVQKVSFTGSTPVGKLLSTQCAPHLKKLTLELGGNGPFIIFEDADLENAVAQLMVAKFRNAGQTCVCPQRVFVQESVRAKVIELLQERMKSDLVMGHGSDEGVTLGPLTTARSLTKANAHVADALAKDAVLIAPLGRDTPANDGYFFAPIILNDCSDDMALAHAESFAPILPIFPFLSEASVIARANHTSMGLTAYVFTTDANRVWRLMTQLDTGNIGVNVGLTTSAEAPFGGWKDSGVGKEAGQGYGIEEYLKVKSVTWGIDWDNRP